MKKSHVVAASAVALSAALASGSALAHGTLAVATANYNAASVTANNGIITVPWGDGVHSAVYSVTNTANNSVSTSLEVNSRFTVTLPSGFSFASTPSLTISHLGSAAVVQGGGIGSQTVTFNITGAPVPVGGTLSLNQVSVQGATALETPGAALQISVQSTNNAEINNNDPAPVFPSVASGPVPFAFTSDTGVTATFSGGSGNNVDLTSPSLGTLFNETIDTTSVTLGSLSLVGSGSLAADGSAAVIKTTDTASVTISGFFNGIVAADAVIGTTVVSAGTVTASTITIPAVPLGGAQLVITTGGTTLMQQNVSDRGGFTAAYAPGAGVTDFIGGSVLNPGDNIPYAGGSSINVTNFLTGSDAGYTSLVRFSNGSSLENQLFAVAQPYSGGAPLVGSLGTIGAGFGTVFTEAQIGTATGLALANSGERATLTIIAIPGGQGVTASGLLVNPGGVVDNVN